MIMRILSTLRRPGWLALFILLLYSGMATYHSLRPLPESLNVATPLRVPGEVRLLVDYTWRDENNERQIKHEIFDRALELIEGAERLIVLDFFLFNDFAGDASDDDMRALSEEVSTVLAARKRAHPDMPVILITDPVNTVYGGIQNRSLQRLEEAGVEVVITRLRALPDSNPAWSGFWRLCCQWFGEARGPGWLPNPVGEQSIPLLSVLELLNFKANHRKTLVVDSPGGWTGMVTSANPHDASSAHSNIGVEFTGQAALDLLETEAAVARFSRPSLDWPDITDTGDMVTESPYGIANESESGTHAIRLQVLTEKAILDNVVRLLENAGPGDALDLSMFYLSHRDVVTALLDAHRRGAELRVLLDPNTSAFGRAKSGIPNQPVAQELTDAGITVRWCNTPSEQCHEKYLLRRAANGEAELIAGSANFTRRNLDNLNLETNVRLQANVHAPAIHETAASFQRRWENHPDRKFSVDYEERARGGWWRYWRYRFMEASGMSSF